MPEFTAPVPILNTLFVVSSVTLTVDKLAQQEHAVAGLYTIAPVIIHTPIVRFVIVNLLTLALAKLTVLLVTGN